MHIGIVTGWISSERAVALRSGENMKDWIQKAGHTFEIFDFPSDIHRFLQRHQTSILAKYFPTKNLKKSQESHQDFDFVIPMFHWIYGEDGQITAFLKTLGYLVAYSPFDTHAICIDKYKTNLFIAKMGIQIPKTLFLEKGKIDTSSHIPYPLIVKPNRWGSSIGTKKVYNTQNYTESCEDIIDDDILVQECIEWREFTVGVYKDSIGYHTLPIIEIKNLKESFFDFSEKYETNGSNEVFLEWEDILQKELADESQKIAQVLHCSWVVRIDYLYNEKGLFFLEVNTIPWFTASSLIPKMWKKAGKNEKEFIDMLLS